MQFFTWIEAHGALTHFPIAFLLAALAFDLGVPLFKKPEWRIVSFWMLVGAVVLSIPALFTGWMSSRSMYGGHAGPAQLQNHWISAVVASVLTLLILAWRIRAKDKMPNSARNVTLVLTFVVSCTIVYTGFLAGKMVFGDATGESTEPSAQNTVAAVPSPTATGEHSVADANAAAPLANAASPQPAKASAAPLPGGFSTPPTLNWPTSTVAPAGHATPNTSKATATPPQPLTPTATPAPPPLDPQLIATGRKLVLDNYCQSCHIVEGKGKKQAPDLTHEATRNADLNWQIEHLKDPKKMRPNSDMPPYDLPPDQLKAMATYLISLH